MKLLLDTCTLLWFLGNDPKLSAPARTALLYPANERWLSPISLLEIALKVRLGKLPLPKPFPTLFPAELAGYDIHLLPLVVHLGGEVLHQADLVARVVVFQLIHQAARHEDAEPALAQSQRLADHHVADGVLGIGGVG